MRSTVLVATVAAALVIGSSNAEDSSKGGMIRRHRSQLAARETTHTLQKRSFQGKATYYGIHSGDQGACGNMLSADDYTVALNQVQYGDLNSRSSYCGKKITITDGSKTTQATITDACPTGEQCHFGALDMSTSLFTFFNPMSVGVFDITWWVSGSGGGGSDSSSSSGKSSSSSSNNDNNNNNSNDSSTNNDKSNAPSVTAKEKTAAKAAAAKKAEESKVAAAKKKAAAAKAAKAAAAKAKAAKEAKAKEKAKIEAAQKSSLNQFSEIMQTLNQIVDNSINGDSASGSVSVGGTSVSPKSSSVVASSESTSTTTTTSTASASYGE